MSAGALHLWPGRLRESALFSVMARGRLCVQTQGRPLRPLGQQRSALVVAGLAHLMAYHKPLHGLVALAHLESSSSRSTNNESTHT